MILPWKSSHPAILGINLPSTRPGSWSQAPTVFIRSEGASPAPETCPPRPGFPPDPFPGDPPRPIMHHLTGGNPSMGGAGARRRPGDACTTLALRGSLPGASRTSLGPATEPLLRFPARCFAALERCCFASGFGRSPCPRGFAAALRAGCLFPAAGFAGRPAWPAFSFCLVKIKIIILSLVFPHPTPPTRDKIQLTQPPYMGVERN
jgi:hypothetical protein